MELKFEYQIKVTNEGEIAGYVKELTDYTPEGLKFVKENKIIVLAMTVIVLSLILLAIPGQFAHANLIGDKYSLHFGGYEFIFNTRTSVLDAKYGVSVIGAGIAIIVMMVLSLVGLVFSKKSSFVMMITGLMMLTVSILFFTMEGAAEKSYPAFVFNEGKIITWVNYVAGALMIIAAALVIYKAVMVMKDEIKHPAKPKGPSYNYLKK